MSPIRILSITSLSGFQFGFNLAIISGALLFLTGAMGLSYAQENLAVSMIVLGALLGSLISGWCANALGRRGVLHLGALLSFIAPFFLPFSFETFLLARGLQGIAIGLVSVAAPLYIAELAPPERRGVYVSTNQLAITIGVFVAYLVNVAYAKSGAWEMMFGVAAIPALIQLIGLFFLPKGIAPEKGSQLPLHALLRPPLLRLLLIGIFLSILQQVTGINAIIYFAPRIFQDAGLMGPSGAILATAGIGLVNVGSTIIAMLVLDRWGRKPALLVSLAGMVLSLGVVIPSLTFAAPWVDWMAVAGLMGYVAFFAFGMGPVPWLVIAEIYPLPIRARAMGLATLFNWLFNFATAYTFLGLSRSITTAGTFALYAALAVIGLFVVWKWLPETKGVALEGD
jgi:MFS family permease